jgi:hypothetical protein
MLQLGAEQLSDIFMMFLIGVKDYCASVGLGQGKRVLQPVPATPAFRQL